MQDTETSNGMAIRDTSAQDIAKPTHELMRGRRRRPIIIAAIALAVMLLAAWIGQRRLSGAQSVSADRVRVAQVTRGDLVRDIAAEAG